MMTSSNENIFCVTGVLCGEFTGRRWIPLAKASDAELKCFPWFVPEETVGKPSWGWWFETLSRPLWRHCNVMCRHGMNHCKQYLVDLAGMYFMSYYNQHRYPLPFLTRNRPKQTICARDNHHVVLDETARVVKQMRLIRAGQSVDESSQNHSNWSVGRLFYFLGARLSTVERLENKRVYQRTSYCDYNESGS